MRITYVAPRYPPMMGGVELHVQKIAESAVRAGHDVTVLTHRHDPRELSRRETINGVRLLRFQAVVPNQNFTFAPSLWAYLHASGHELGVVHAHAYHALPALAAAVCKRFPLLFTPHYHGTGHSRLRTALHPPYRRLGRIIFRRADRVVCVSRAEAELVWSHFPEARPRTVVIHNGVDIDAIEKADPYDVHGPVLLSAGRLERYKQVHATIRAMAHLPSCYSLIVTGDGPARAELESLAGELRLGERVRFLGRVSDGELHRWFRTAAAYVSMSGNEAYPLTPLEALVGGARVVASDIPAHREVAAATGGSIELVAHDCASRTLAERLQAVVSGPARPAAVDSWDEVASGTVRVYEEVLEERSGRRCSKGLASNVQHRHAKPAKGG